MNQINPQNYVCYFCQKQCTRGDPCLIRAAGRLYHKQCFQCDSCGVSVLEKFYLTNEMILCENDYYRCRQCKQSILNHDELQEFGDYKYHTDCLVCPGCTITPTTTTNIRSDYFDYNGRLYCEYHYSLIKGVECIGCGQAVFDHQEEEDRWHTECSMIHKYWQISLLTPEGSNYKDRNECLSVQNEYATKRIRIWKILSQFEQDSSTIIKNILLTQQYSTCHELVHQVSILFQTLDYLYLLSTHHHTNFQYEKPVQLLMDQVVSFFHILCETKSSFEREFMVKMAKLISQYLRELVRLSLQQALLLERKESHVMNQVLEIYINHNNQTLTLEYLSRSIQLLEITLKEQEVAITDNKSTFITSPFLSRNKNMVGSTPTLHLQTQELPVRRSVSTRYEPKPAILTPTSSSRMETLKRALTTNRKNSTTSKPSKSYSVNNPPLFISLSEIPTHASPPLSPPSAVQHHQHVWTMPMYLPELNPTQDAILRHTALLFVEDYTDDPFNIEDYLAVVDTKKTSSSLWGKLKAHILTPNGSNTMIDLTPLPEKRIGVSLSQLGFTFSGTQDDPALDAWVNVSPSVASCFSSRAQIPNFLKDCILCMIKQDMNTEGIFRKNGNIRTLRDMCETLDTQSQKEGGWTDFFEGFPIIQLAAFIKKFTRELPEPLLTFKLHKLFLMANGSEGLLHYVLCLLPKPNRDTFFLILALLNWVAQKSDANKMDIENLARVMTPNILYPESKQSQLDASLCHVEINIIAFLIGSYERFIQVII
ncbi:unnamed protein product [Rhizopus stolonifer]